MVKKCIVLLPLAVIAILATIFQYPIRIVNALTLETVPNYGIHISIVRILFEPVLGVLLYLNRSLYPLQELPKNIKTLLLHCPSEGVLNTLKRPYSR